MVWATQGGFRTPDAMQITYIDESGTDQTGEINMTDKWKVVSQGLLEEAQEGSRDQDTPQLSLRHTKREHAPNPDTEEQGRQKGSRQNETAPTTRTPKNNPAGSSQTNPDCRKNNACPNCDNPNPDPTVTYSICEICEGEYCKECGQPGENSCRDCWTQALQAFTAIEQDSNPHNKPTKEKLERDLRESIHRSLSKLKSTMLSLKSVQRTRTRRSSRGCRSTLHQC